MYSESDGLGRSPITLDDVQRIEQTQLSTSKKHYLRLLAHCLACFKTMDPKAQNGFPPNKTTCLKWFRSQSGLNLDQNFFEILLKQFQVVGKELDELSKVYQISPFELTLDHLIDFLNEGDQK